MFKRVVVPVQNVCAKCLCVGIRLRGRRARARAKARNHAPAATPARRHQMPAHFSPARAAPAANTVTPPYAGAAMSPVGQMPVNALPACRCGKGVTATSAGVERERGRVRRWVWERDGRKGGRGKAGKEEAKARAVRGSRKGSEIK